MLWVLYKHCKDTVMFQLFLMIVLLILFSERQIASGLRFARRNYIISQNQYKYRAARDDVGTSQNVIY